MLKRFGGSTILENNIVQTIGSAGESLASGVVFTIPALIFLVPYGPAYFTYFQITMLAIAGGILGVLMMVPLRRALIVKEHGVLPYPEGTACADVLIAGERGGALAKTVFMGLGFGALWKGLSWIIQLFRTDVGVTLARNGILPNASLHIDISPEYMGVGYVIGPRIAGVMFARRRALLAGAVAAAQHPGQLHDRPVSTGAGERSAHRSDDGWSVVERLHQVHRRRRRARGGTDHARTNHPDDRFILPRKRS